MSSLRLDLEQLGLPTHSADMYERLLRLGESKAADLISDSGTHRQLVYAALKDLERRKLAKKVMRDKVAHFQALSLDPLLADIRHKEQLAARVIEESKRLKATPQTEVLVFQGAQGMNDFMELTLETKAPIRLIGAHFRFKEVYPELWYPWHQKREEHDISFQALMPSGVDVPEDVSFELRQLSMDVSPTVTWLFGDYVAHLVWIDREQTVAFVTHHALVAQQQQELFETLWARAKKKDSS